MSIRPRIALPTLERTGPIRNWSTIIGAGARNVGSGDPVEAAVKVGYQVLEDVLSGGRRAASGMRPPRFASFGAGSQTPEELGSRLMQSASDFMQLWLQMFEVMLPRSPATASAMSSPSPSSPAAASVSPPAVDLRTRVRIGVASRRPTEVSVDLRGGAITPSLVIHRLRFFDGSDEIPPISVTASVLMDTLVINVLVPDAQPAGRYNACIVDAGTGLPQGTLSLLILPESPPDA